MISTVIFDFDGVIVDSEGFHKKALDVAFREAGFEFNNEVYKKYFFGISLREGLTGFLNENGRMDDLEKMINLKKDFDKYYSDEMVTYDDAVEFIEQIHGKYDLAIASGARRNMIDLALAKLKFNEYFKTIVSAENCSHGKPHPEVYEKTIEILGMRKETAVAIEDHPNGVISAKAAGLKVIAVTHTNPAEMLKDADLVIDELCTDVLELF